MPHSGFPAAVGRFTEEGLGGHIVATSVEESIPKRHYACKYPPLRPLTADEQKLVLDNLGLARQGAWRMAVANAAIRREIKGFRRYAEQFYDDFYDAAVIGLCVAAQRWDPSQGFTFGTYAFPTIRGAVQQATEYAAIHAGSRNQCRKGRGRAIHFCDLGVATKGSQWADRALPNIDVWYHEEEIDDGAITPELNLLLNLALPRKRDMEIFSMYIFDDLTLGDVAKVYGITRQRVLQIVERCLRQLKKSEGFMQGLVAQMKRRRLHMNADDFRGTGIGTLLA